MPFSPDGNRQCGLYPTAYEDFAWTILIHVPIAQPNGSTVTYTSVPIEAGKVPINTPVNDVSDVYTSKTVKKHKQG